MEQFRDYGHWAYTKTDKGWRIDNAPKGHEKAVGAIVRPGTKEYASIEQHVADVEVPPLIRRAPFEDRLLEANAPEAEQLTRHDATKRTPYYEALMQKASEKYANVGTSVEEAAQHAIQAIGSGASLEKAGDAYRMARTYGSQAVEAARAGRSYMNDLFQSHPAEEAVDIMAHKAPDRPIGSADLDSVAERKLSADKVALQRMKDKGSITAELASKLEAGSTDAKPEIRHIADPEERVRLMYAIHSDAYNKPTPLPRWLWGEETAAQLEAAPELRRRLLEEGVIGS